MAYRIEISYRETVEYRNFDDFMNAVGLLMHGGMKEMKVSQVDDEEEVNDEEDA